MKSFIKEKRYTKKEFTEKLLEFLTKNNIYDIKNQRYFTRPLKAEKTNYILNLLKKNGPLTSKQMNITTGKQTLTSLRNSKLISYDARTWRWSITGLGLGYLAIIEDYTHKESNELIENYFN